MNILLLTALSLVAPLVRLPAPRGVDLRYRPQPVATWVPAAAVDTVVEPVDLRDVAMTILDGHAPGLARYVRGRTVVLPLVARTASGETAMGAAVQLSTR